MSFHCNRNNSSSERLQRTRGQRRESTGFEGNTNGNNSKGIGSYISNYTRSTENSNRMNPSRTPGGLRMKSNLVGSMTATFEQLKKDSLPPSGASSVKSPSSSRLESITTQAPIPKATSATGASPRIENGTANHAPNTADTLKLENGSAGKRDVNANVDEEQAAARVKSSSSARRGKQQREKRMLRQKRRSTGVVNLKGSDDEDKKEKEDGNDEKNEETETAKNTLSNELSPPPSASCVKTKSERTQAYGVTDGSSSIFKSTSSTSSFTPSHSHQASDNVFLSGDSMPQSPNMPNLNSSRRRGKRSTNEKSRQDSNSQENREVCELRDKLSAAETTIGKLNKEIKEMETDITHLAEENCKLKHENKLLEDENMSMLMVLKQLRSGRE